MLKNQRYSRIDSSTPLGQPQKPHTYRGLHPDPVGQPPVKNAENPQISNFRNPKTAQTQRKFKASSPLSAAYGMPVFQALKTAISGIFLIDYQTVGLVRPDRRGSWSVHSWPFAFPCIRIFIFTRLLANK